MDNGIDDDVLLSDDKRKGLNNSFLTSNMPGMSDFLGVSLFNSESAYRKGKQKHSGATIPIFCSAATETGTKVQEQQQHQHATHQEKVIVIGISQDDLPVEN